MVLSMVLMAMPEEYWRGYENGKQESAARIRELEAALADKDAALAAADETLISSIKELRVWERIAYHVRDDITGIRAIINEALGVIALIAKAKGEK